MIDGCLKLEDGRFEGVLRGKFQAQNEFSTGVGRVLGSFDSNIPGKQVICDTLDAQDVLEGCLFEFCAFLWAQRGRVV